MPKIDAVMRKPWIPPPAKSSKRLIFHKNYFAADESLTVQDKQEALSFSITPLCDSPSPKSEIKQYRTFHVQDDISISKMTSTTSIQCQTVQNFSDKCLASGDYLNQLQELQNDIKLIKMHHQSLKTCSELLHRPMKVAPIDERAVRNMVLQADHNINSFLHSSQEFENTVSSLEDSTKNGSKDLQNYASICQHIKEVTILKLLKAYDIITSSMKFLFDVQLQGELSLFEKDQSILSCRLEFLKEHLSLRDQHVGEIEKKFQLAEEQLLLTKQQKKSLEERNSQLTHQLSQTTLMMERLQLQMETQEHFVNNVSDCDKLLEVIDELREKHKAEKEALKKAFKMQKVHAQELEDSLNEVRGKMSEKQCLTYDLAEERDQWKMQLTSANNKLIESEHKIEKLQRKNMVLQEHMEQIEVTFEEEMKKLKTSIKAKDVLLRESHVEYDEVKSSASLWQKKCEDIQNELTKQVEMKESNTRQNLVIKENLDQESQALISLLREVKGQFSKNAVEQVGSSNCTEHLPAQYLEMQDVLEREQKERVRLERRCDDLEKLLQSSRNSSHDQLLSHAPGNDENFENRLKLLEEELECKSQKITSLESQKYQGEQTYSLKLKELQSKLDRSTASFENLRKYLDVLKSSYTNVFGLT